MKWQTFVHTAWRSYLWNKLCVANHDSQYISRDLQLQTFTAHWFKLNSFRTIPVLLHFVGLCQHGYRLQRPHPFSRNSFIYQIWCLFTFCPYSINITQSNWKCATTLVKKNVCDKIFLHACIQARRAALVRNYFSGRNNFGFHGSKLPSLCVLLSDFWPNKLRRSL